jgi:hypothetical protein
MKTKAIRVGSITLVHKTWDGDFKDDVLICYTEYSDCGAGPSETEVDISYDDALRIVNFLIDAYPPISNAL